MREGETLTMLVDEFRRAVIIATIEAEPSMVAAARALGITREGLYKLRVKYGLEIRPPIPRPVPKDWRKRLEATET